MKRLLLFAGLAGALTLTTFAQAVPDPKVDKPSFGRIVYGMTGGKVILPKDAWEGYYPDGSGTNAVPGDITFNGLAIVAGVQTRYLGDLGGPLIGANARDYAWVVANPGAVNASIVAGGIITDQPESATKLGFISRDGWESKVSMFTPPSVSALTTLFGIHTNAGSTVGPPLGYTVPFGLAYTTPTDTYYSDIPANNTGSDTYNHVKIFRVTDITNDYYGHYFAGFEDLNFLPSPSPSYQRFDWNDTVIELVPEPAFYQMAGVLGLGALGLFRMRRRSSK